MFFTNQKMGWPEKGLLSQNHWPLSSDCEKPKYMLKNLRAKKDGVGIPAFREARVNLSEIIETN